MTKVKARKEIEAIARWRFEKLLRDHPKQSVDSLYSQQDRPQHRRLFRACVAMGWAKKRIATEARK